MIKEAVKDDTLELLKECNAGIKMGATTIDEVCERVKSEELLSILNKCKEEHQRLGSKTHELLNRSGESGKEPNPMAKGMSWIKTNVMITVNETDATIADLITDGCNMGVKSLNRYLNKYESASSEVKKIAGELIALEENLAKDIRKYL